MLEPRERTVFEAGVGAYPVTHDEIADMAAFVASDKASGMTGTTVNLTMGSLDDQS